MGPVLVATMVQGEVDDSSTTKLHPFFTKSDYPDSPVPQITQPTENAATAKPDATYEQSTHSYPDGSLGRKRRKTDASLPEDDSESKKPRRKRKSAGQQLNGAILSHLTKPEQENPTATAPSVEQPHSFPTPPLSEVSAKPVDDVQISVTADLNKPRYNSAQQQTPNSAQPKKVLKFNPKTGTLGSPPKPKPVTKPSRVVVIQYGRDAEQRKYFGDRITKILEGKQELPQPAKKELIRDAQMKSSPSNRTEKPSTTHPFFAGKTKHQPEDCKSDNSAKKISSERHTVFMSTPVSPRKPKNILASGKAVQFSISSMGVKIPGAMHPLWPAQGMAHIRGRDEPGPQSRRRDSSFRSRKSKGAAIAVPSSQTILTHLIDHINFTTLRSSLPKDENFTAVPSELRLPQRHFESGKKLQRRIRSQLRTRFPNASILEEQDMSADELARERPSRAHPAIDRLYRTLISQLSAYDRSCCESLSWVQKYAPSTAAQVLQPGKEATLLSNWLQTLRVQAVEAGSSECDKIKGKADGAPKKKRKKNKLDDFVVDSDDEDDEMDEISDDNEDWEATSGFRLLKKSVMRNIEMTGRGPKDQGRLKNTILLSGPHGSGKTAAVYAVAKELEFEVFEINSGSRRSGKDILEKVGDMTRNHLVQHNRTESTAIDEDEVAEDIKSGKQGMMTTFFKPKGPIPKKKPQPKQPQKDTEKEAKAPPKSQKQSLIFLEEVDVLFEEDKQFWTTLVGLIAQSKRPFIMTCNDESLVPIQNLSLHGIFRFSPAPTSLAVDLCILIAANEGHALQRSAVDALYCSRNNDLRATITELNYWCQIGVGDRRGGFDWFYLRWPKGSDLDEQGDVVRVISQDTYQKGMGWVNRDSIVVTEPLEAEEEVMRQVWDSWEVDVGDWCDTVNMGAWATEETKSYPSNLASLDAYADFCSSMSDADIYSSGSYGTKLQETIDPTLPDMRDNIREDFILGLVPLDADPLIRQVSPNATISTSIKSLARSRLQSVTTQWSKDVENSQLRSVDERRTTSILDSSFRFDARQITRMDLALAFDPIAVAPRGAPTTHLEPSVFDRTTKVIVLDVAPWVRGIIAYEQQLMQRRLKLSNLLSEGGKRKRMRSTRSAMSALEGGERRTTRKERHFGDSLSTPHVMRTAGDKWTSLILDDGVKSEADESAAPSSPLSDELSSQ